MPWRLERCTRFGPTFRAEKSKTRRHLTEFWMVEPEMAYADLNDVIALAEGLIVSVVGRVLDKRRERVEAPRTRYVEARSHQGAVSALTTTRRHSCCIDKGLPFQHGGDLGGTDETVLSQQFDKPVA